MGTMSRAHTAFHALLLPRRKKGKWNKGAAMRLLVPVLGVCVLLLGWKWRSLASQLQELEQQSTVYKMQAESTRRDADSWVVRIALVGTRYPAGCSVQSPFAGRLHHAPRPAQPQDRRARRRPKSNSPPLPFPVAPRTPAPQKVANSKDYTITNLQRTTERLNKEIAAERKAGQTEREETLRCKEQFSTLSEKARAH